jgi:dTDP-4-dehydrorhamnose 3,5-epimerase-like enzyme
MEFAVNPKDTDLAIEWPSNNLIFSERDLSAPTLKEFLSAQNY